MADHLSDEEQLEALKKWWKSNGSRLLLTIVVVAGGWFGWQYWQDSQQQKAEESAVVYMAMLDAMQAWEQDAAEENAEVIAAHAETLKKIGENNRYGVYAAMSIARLATTADDLENAAAELEWALVHSDDEALNGLIRLRLASIQYSRSNLDDALSLLGQPHAPEYKSLYDELKGDILTAKGDNAGAATAYQAALEKIDESDSRARALLELKINELTSADTAEVGKEDT